MINGGAKSVARGPWNRTPLRSRPTAEVENLDTLHHRPDRAGGGKRTVGDFLLLSAEQPAEISVHSDCRRPGNRIIVLQICPQRDDLERRVQPGNVAKPPALKPRLRYT
jgi:hypothetical protein